MPDYVVKKPFDDQSNFLIYGLKVNFPGIRKSKLYKLLQPTENIFNTGTEITQFSPKEFEINEQLEVQGSFFCMIKVTLFFITELNIFANLRLNKLFWRKKSYQPTQIISSNNH